VTELTAKQAELCEASETDYSDLRAFFINCTLKRSPEVSNTQGLMDVSMEIMRRNGVEVECIRAVDHEIATGVWPDMTEHGWEIDEWPAIFERVMAADILVLGMSIWLGEKSSIATQIVERLYGNSHLLNDDGQYAYYGRVGGCLVTGNEDGVKHCAMNTLYSLQHLGYTIPPRPTPVGSARPAPDRPTSTRAPAVRGTTSRTATPPSPPGTCSTWRGSSRMPAASLPTATSAPPGTPAVASTSRTPSTAEAGETITGLRPL
jgi:multimeric flavodoxin WrbA